ncbi:MAG: hypothetical protein COC12_04405 [Rhodobacteraceae bacterium]|nr:MAG: hypothetical protein COC12_04405 [Paracoccaceae bacterium]
MGEQNSINRHEEETPRSDHRISTKAARKMLGMVGRNYSDDDLQDILTILYGMAEEAYESYRGGGG